MPVQISCTVNFTHEVNVFYPCKFVLQEEPKSGQWREALFSSITKAFPEDFGDLTFGVDVWFGILSKGPYDEDIDEDLVSYLLYVNEVTNRKSYMGTVKFPCAKSSEPIKTHKYRVNLYEDGIAICLADTNRRQRDAVELWICDIDKTTSLEWVPDYDGVIKVFASSPICSMETHRYPVPNANMSVMLERME